MIIQILQKRFLTIFLNYLNFQAFTNSIVALCRSVSHYRVRRLIQIGGCSGIGYKRKNRGTCPGSFYLRLMPCALQSRLTDLGVWNTPRAV